MFTYGWSLTHVPTLSASSAQVTSTVWIATGRHTILTGLLSTGFLALFPAATTAHHMAVFWNRTLIGGTTQTAWGMFSALSVRKCFIPNRVYRSISKLSIWRKRLYSVPNAATLQQSPLNLSNTIKRSTVAPLKFQRSCSGPQVSALDQPDDLLSIQDDHIQEKPKDSRGLTKIGRRWISTGMLPCRNAPPSRKFHLFGLSEFWLKLCSDFMRCQQGLIV